MRSVEQRQRRMSSQGASAIVAMLVIVAAGWFIWRALLDHSPGRLDFVLVYCASRAWVTGANPYDLADIARVWVEAGGPEARGPMTRVFPHLIYPPPTLLMLSPFGFLPWRWAEPAWVLANVAFLGGSLWAIARLACFTLRQRRTWLFIAVALAFMPVHTTFRHGQTPLYPLMFIAIGLLLAGGSSRGAAPRGWVSGVMQGLATLIKPQMGLPFIALEVVRQRFSAVLAAAITVGLVGAVSVLPFVVRNVDWLDSWRGNLQAVSAPGNQLDPTPTNEWRYQMINLHVPLHGFIESRPTVNVLVMAIVGVLGGLYFLWPRPRSESGRSGPPLPMAGSMVAVLSLMFVYHRYYDAVLLLLPLAWAIGRVAAHRRDVAGWIMLALIAPFMLNSASAMYWLDYTGRVPQAFTESALWRIVVIPHQGWLILMMGVFLAIERRRIDRASSTLP